MVATDAHLAHQRARSSGQVHRVLHEPQLPRSGHRPKTVDHLRVPAFLRCGPAPADLRNRDHTGSRPITACPEDNGILRSVLCSAWLSK